MPKDRVQREIEELLGKLDNFVPEERLRERRKERAAAERTEPPAWQRYTRPFTRITLGHLLLAGLALFAVSYIFDDSLGSWAIWVTLGGVVLAGGAFVMSVLNGGNTRASLGSRGRVQKRWRGQVIEYGEPRYVERVRGWFRRRRRP